MANNYCVTCDHSFAPTSCVCPKCGTSIGVTREIRPNEPAQLGLVETRETTHGSFFKVAYMAQRGKGILERGTNWPTLPDMQREALEMIMCKIARILEGKSTHADHWDDIAGYAELGKRATYSDCL